MTTSDIRTWGKNTPSAILRDSRASFLYSTGVLVQINGEPFTWFTSADQTVSVLMQGTIDCFFENANPHDEIDWAEKIYALEAYTTEMRNWLGLNDYLGGKVITDARKPKIDNIPLPFSTRIVWEN